MQTPRSEEPSASSVDGTAQPTVAVDGTPPSGPASVAPAKPKSPLATSAMIIGIVAMVCAVIPGLSFLAFLPAVAAAILGIIAMATKKPRQGRALTGVILGPIALLVAIIVSVATIAAGVGGAVSPKPAGDTTVGEPAEEPVEAEQTEEPQESAPKPETIPADVVYQGTGDSVVPIELVDGAGQVAVATITHVGERNFAIWSLDDGMEQQDLLVNTIGNYTGTVLFNNGYGGTDTSSLEISADGAWTVTVRSLLSIREFTGASASGTGDDVVVYRGAAGAATISHDGARNFAIWTYGNDSDLVVNEIGPYSGTTRWTAGPSVVVVSADGNWSITVG